MPLNIKNAEVERLAAEVALLSGTSRTVVIRQALLDRRERLFAGADFSRTDIQVA